MPGTNNFKTTLLSAAATAALLASAGVANAATPHPTPTTTSSEVSSTTDTTTALTTEQQLTQTQIISQTVLNHLNNVNINRQLDGAQVAGLPETGISAGEETAAVGQKLSAWTSFSYNEAENDSPGIAYESDTKSASIGLDYKLADPLTIGFFVSKSWSDTDSAFNGGGSETDGTTFGPYVSIAFNDWLSMDASYARTSSEIDNRRVAGGVTITGTQDSTTDYFAAGLTASHWFANSIGLSGRVGYSISETKNDAYVDSTGTAIASSSTDLDQLQVGGRAMYYTSNVMPYVGVTYINDVNAAAVRTAANPQPANDDDDFLLQAGLSLYGDTAFSGGIDLSYNAAREENDAWGIGANVSYSF